MKFKEFKKYFVDKRYDKKDLILRIKPMVEDVDVLISFVDSFERELKPFTKLFESILKGKNSLPKSLDQLNKSEDYYFSESVFKELNWQVLSFLKHKEEINIFLNLKEKFEIYLLKGEYTKAREVLERIENEICISFWGIENRFILDEFQFGTEKNWEYRNLLLEERNQIYVQIFGNIFSLKAEKNISFFQYNDQLNLWFFQQNMDDPIYLPLVEYFRFRSNYFSAEKYSEFGHILFNESKASIVDRYLLSTRIINHLVSVESDKLNEILKLNVILKDNFCDKSSQNISFYFTDYDYRSDDFEEYIFLDLYTSGYYDECVKSIKNNIISNDKFSIEMLELYSKSLVENGNEYIPITEGESFINNLTEAFYNVYKKNDLTDESLITIVKNAYIFNNSSIGLNLYNFVSNELGWKNDINFNFISALNSNFLNPRVLILDSDFPCSKELILNKFLKINNNVTLRVIQNLISDNENIFENIDFVIPEIKRDLYKIRNLIKNKRFELAIQMCNELDKEKLTVVSKYEIYSNLYLCYFENGEYSSCLQKFVEVYLENQNLTKKMNTNSLIDIILKQKFKNLNTSDNIIELPIFFKINYNDKIKTKQAYEKFLIVNECSKPTEIFKKVEIFDHQKFIYFLRNVCITEIMQLSKSFNSTYEVYDERIEICKFLCEIDSENIDNYKEEIAELTQKNTISKVIGNIDERKIFVNETKIRQIIAKFQKQSFSTSESISPLNNDTYERYLNLLSFIKNKNEYKDLSDLYFGENGEFNLVERKKNYINSNEDAVVIYLPAFRIFSTFFLYIRDLFVFNKEYGLDAYLSTRIRHGTLPNHLRSVFENYSLVTTQTDNVYSENLIWKEKITFEDEKMVRLQNILGDFSRSIDDFTKEIKDNYIQCYKDVKTDLTTNMFDFSYTEEDLIWLFIQDFNADIDINLFIDKCFIELWKRTEICLKFTRQKFNNDFRDEYVRLIDDLHSSISTFEEKAILSELLSNIMTCRTEIQTKLNNISKWFRRSEGSYEGEYKVKLLADTSIEITKNINPNFPFSITTFIDDNLTIKGEYYQHFIDLISNCLFNMIKHSHVESENLDANMEIGIENENLKLKFCNKVSDEKLHIEKLNLIKDSWKSLDQNINKEEGTGYPKIKKIIYSDLNRKYSSFDFNFTDDLLTIELTFEIKDL